MKEVVLASPRNKGAARRARRRRLLAGGSEIFVGKGRGGYRPAFCSRTSRHDVRFLSRESAVVIHTFFGPHELTTLPALPKHHEQVQCPRHSQ